MVATPAEIATGFAERFATIGNGLRTHAVWPGKGNPPFIVAVPGDGTDDELTFSEGFTHPWYVVLVGGIPGDYERAQLAILNYMPQVRAALEADESLGGLVDCLLIGAWEEPGLIEVNGVSYHAVRRNVTVID